MDSWLTPIVEAGLGVFALALFAALALSTEVGLALGRWRRRAREGDKGRSEAVSVLTGGMVTLVAFLLGLTVDFAQNRFETRRELVAVEANAIDTAWRRADLIAAPDGPALAALIARYDRARLAFTTANLNSAGADPRPTAALEERIWTLATDAARREPTPITATVITALTGMFDAAQSQRFAFQGRIPEGVLSLLVAGAVIAIGSLGYQLGLAGQRQTPLTFLLIGLWVAAMVITVDLNRPRLGAVRVDPAPLVWTLQGIARETAAAPTSPPRR